MSRLRRRAISSKADEVGRVGHADAQQAAVFVEHQRAEAARLRFRQQLDELRLGLEYLEVDESALQLACQGLGNAFFGDEADLDQHATQLAPAALLFVERELQLLFGDEVLLYQQIAEANFLRTGHRGYACCWLK